jgi:hypothetical protein
VLAGEEEDLLLRHNAMERWPVLQTLAAHGVAFNSFSPPL